MLLKNKVSLFPLCSSFLLIFFFVHSLPLCLFQGRYRLNCDLLETVSNYFVLETDKRPCHRGPHHGCKEDPFTVCGITTYSRYMLFWLAPSVHSFFPPALLFSLAQTVKVSASWCLFLSPSFDCFSSQPWFRSTVPLSLRLVQFIPFTFKNTCTHRHTVYISSVHKSSTCTHVLCMGSICSLVLSAVLSPCCLGLTATGDTKSSSCGGGRTTARQNKGRVKGHGHVKLIYCWQDINNFLSEGLWFGRFPLFITECNNNV